SAGALVAFIFGAGIFGTLYLIPLFVQSVLGYTATRAGELLMPSGLVMGIAFPIAGRLGDMISPRIPIVCGLVVFGFSNILFYWADADTGFWTIAFWIILGRIGLSFIMPSLNAGALSRLPPELLGQGTGSINFVRQLGGALGVGMLSAYVDRRYAFHADAFASTQNAGNGSLAALRTQIEALLGRSGLPDTQLAGGTFDYVGKVIAAQANAASFNDGFAIAGLVFALAILPALIMRGLPHRRP
ncbi:MAG TPA: MFS transporter, partial [Rhodocyclaceae bacterium]|nr:MFS transporter [Rhodocyclaceae bacterium]